MILISISIVCLFLFNSLDSAIPISPPELPKFLVLFLEANGRMESYHEFTRPEEDASLSSVFRSILDSISPADASKLDPEKSVSGFAAKKMPTSSTAKPSVIKLKDTQALATFLMEHKHKTGYVGLVVTLKGVEKVKAAPKRVFIL
jgi:hypothetical protein